MVETLILILLAGLAWGSFLNVVIYRLPLGMSLVKPPSFCPWCRQRIPFYDNIPLVSFLLLRGRCRKCGASIPLSTLLVEILTPLSFLLLYRNFSLHPHFFASCVFASAMIVLGFIDFDHQILPDEITLPGLLLALVYALFRPDMVLRDSLFGSLVGAGVLLFVYGAYYALRKKEGMGMGDVTMMLLIGAFLGWRLTIFTLILASFSGALVGILVVVWGKKDLQHSLPFGTFLAPAACVALLWGESILSAYWSLFQTP